MTPTIVVNGRFTTQPLTGVQRYAHELVGRLAGTSGWTVVLALPPDRLVELRPGDAVPHELDDRWWGGQGHLWEQRRLPGLVRRAGGDLLFGPAGWGPLWWRRQLVVIHDLHPITHPELFVPGFVRWTRLATPALARLPRRLGVTSEHVAAQVRRHLRVSDRRLDRIPPAVGAPFVDRPLDDVAVRPRDYCLFVGGDKRQKNLAFIRALWPQVHRELGLELVVTARPIGSRVGADLQEAPGVRIVTDPADDELVELYAGALCLLWPSVAEGFGIPLLEAMAVGTPFLANDVGAARELAVEAGQVVPLDADVWIERLRPWRRDGVADLARRSADVAREATWDRSTDALVAALERSLRRR